MQFFVTMVHWYDNWWWIQVLKRNIFKIVDTIF